jgi:hypothetical protein
VKKIKYSFNKLDRFALKHKKRNAISNFPLFLNSCCVDHERDARASWDLIDIALFYHKTKKAYSRA